MFISEVCDGHWANFNYDEFWTRNEKHSTTRTNQNWCGRAVPKTNFNTLLKDRPEDFLVNSVPILETVNGGV